MRRHQTAMFNTPPTPPADSPFSSLSDSLERSLSRSALFTPEGKKNTTLPPRSSKDKVADSRQLFTAQELVSQLRQYEGGVDIRPEYPLGVQEFKKLEACIDQLPETDSLKGFWYYKLRYDYDSDMQLFRILMTTRIHERIISLISKQINKWLDSLQEHNSPVIKEFASAVLEDRSTRIKYSSDEVSVPMSLEEAAGSSTSSEPGSDPSPSPDHSSHTAAPTRTTTILTRSHAQGRISAPTNPIPQELLSSDTQGSNTKETHYSPDNSWRFISPQVKDERAAFILEIAKTQREEDLRNKIEGLLGTCGATAVLACRTDIPQSKRAILELWSRNESEDTQQTLLVPDLLWRTDILNEEGMLVDNQSLAQISLEDFITLDSYHDYLSQYTDNAIELFDKLPPLAINTSMLGHELIELRTEVDKEREKKRKRGEEVSHAASGEHEVEPDCKRRSRQRKEAKRKQRRMSNALAE